MSQKLTSVGPVTEPALSLTLDQDQPPCISSNTASSSSSSEDSTEISNSNSSSILVKANSIAVSNNCFENQEDRSSALTSSSGGSCEQEPEPENFAWTTDEEDFNDNEESDSADSHQSTPEPEEPSAEGQPEHLQRRNFTKIKPPSPTSNLLPPVNDNLQPPRQSLRAQIKLLIELALIHQLNENKEPHPRRAWWRRQIDTFLLRLLVFIMRYNRELCILFLVFASGLASLRTSPVKTRSTATPKPFFEDGKSMKYIEDFYQGHYVDLVQNKINLGPAFVFYYAPWDSESVAARNVFTRVAEYFYTTLPNRIRFYAVNCWWPQGECRKNYKNLSHFPIFVAHIEKNAGIIYSGPIRSELIIKFLTSIMKPLTRIDTEEEIWRFRAQHDAIMLGYFNFTNSDSIAAYETYLQMALRSFEADPFGQVGFGFFLKPELAEKFFLTSSNVISLVLFNEIHTAKWTGDKDTQGSRGPVGQVANWVMERTRKTPITWAYQIRTGFANRPVALGPSDLVDELTKGPVMLLITRRYFPSSYSPFYAQIKEIAMDYFNCNKSGNVTKLRKTIHKINSEWMTLWNSVAKICASQNIPSDRCNTLRKQLLHWESKKYAVKRESIANYEDISQRLNFTGFACLSDRQFKFFAIDPVDMPHFVELGFGGLGFHNDSDPVLFIIDAQNDLIQPITKFNISEIASVIYNYTIEVENEDEDKITTFVSKFWSESSKSKPIGSAQIIENNQAAEGCTTHVREIIGGSGGTGDNGGNCKQSVSDTYDKELDHLQNRNKRNNLVLRLSSNDLKKFMDSKEPFHMQNPLFLMYTAKFCGICGISLSSFVALSRFMQDHYDQGVNITFAKIDMMKNSLPHPLAPQKLPTFIYFPGNDRRDFRVFPAESKVTTRSLLKFLLAEMEPETRINLSLLSPGCSKGEKECLRKSREANAEDSRRIKRYQSKCVSQLNQASNFSSSSRENCIAINKLSVVDKLQNIFNEIHHGYYSHPREDVEEELGVNIETLKTQDLDHLRSMKITLDVT